MNTIIEIFRNIGKIVILLFQIIYESIIDYINSYNKPKPKHNNPLYKRTKRNNKEQPYKNL